MVSALTNDKHVAFNVFVYHIPGIVAVFGQAANVQAFTLPQSMIHKPFMLANFNTFGGFDDTGLSRQVLT